MLPLFAYTQAFVPVTRKLLRPTVRHLRAWPPGVSVERARRGSGKDIALLPSTGRKQSSLLRIYNIAHELRGMGWCPAVLPSFLTLHQRQRLLARLAPYAVIMQGARHALNRPDLYPQSPIIYDIDDADFHLPHLAQPVGEAMPQVAAVLAGARYIARWCRGAGAKRVDVVWTGAPVSRRARLPHVKRRPVVAWAQTRPMTYLHEAEWVRHFVGQLGEVCPDITLRLFDRQPGDDPGFAQSIEARGVTVEWVRSCGYSDYLRHLDDVSLGMAPLSDQSPFSRGKSFGKVLAYLDRHVPVLASDACEHGAFFSGVGDQPVMGQANGGAAVNDSIVGQRHEVIGGVVHVNAVGKQVLF